jgi:hypothetical protein
LMTPPLSSSRAQPRDLFSARKAEAMEKRSLRAALRSLVETTVSS